MPRSALVDAVVGPAVQRAMDLCLAELDAVTVADLCREAEERAATGKNETNTDFTI
jgi:Rrf2 family iron-sulfur cluster assembly transcriptional regulator